MKIKSRKSIKTDVWTNLHNLQCLISTQPRGCAGGCAEIIKDYILSVGNVNRIDLTSGT